MGRREAGLPPGSGDGWEEEGCLEVAGGPVCGRGEGLDRNGIERDGCGSELLCESPCRKNKRGWSGGLRKVEDSGLDRDEIG